MNLARVIGRATSTVKHPSLQGQKLLILEMLDQAGKPEGEPQLAIDSLGARKGDLVMATTDGTAVQEMVKSDQCPVRWSVLGIAD
jgi:ethanolamine utilization protein EutN